MAKSASTASNIDSSLGLRAIALFKGLKGVLVLAVGSGALLLVHRDVQRLAERLVAHFNLNPASHYPRIFLQMAKTCWTSSRSFNCRPPMTGAFDVVRSTTVRRANLSSSDLP